MKKMLYWLPRILSILFIAFISIFALDVFSEPQWLMALVMHLLPSFFLIILAAVAWKNELLGGSLFLAAGFFMLFVTRFEAWIIGVPAVIVGALFLANRYLSKRKGSTRET